jgi:hypothetical protein
MFQKLAILYSNHYLFKIKKVLFIDDVKVYNKFRDHLETQSIVIKLF